MDSGWLKALELPAKITGGIAAGSIITLVLNSRGVIELYEIGYWLRPTIFIVAVFSGALFVAGIINELVTATQSWSGKKAALADKTAFKQKALAHLDALSEEEIHIVAKSLREGSPSVKWWVHSGGAAQLVHKGLLDMLPGQYPSDHWPFVFRDFAWETIQSRKDEYLARAAELEEKLKGRRR